jgi:hypothetical protein
VVDLDGGATDRVGQAQPPDVLARAVVEHDRQRRVDVVDETGGHPADRLAGPLAVAVIGVAAARPADGGAFRAVGLVVGEAVAAPGRLVTVSVDCVADRPGRGDPVGAVVLGDDFT